MFEISNVWFWFSERTNHKHYKPMNDPLNDLKKIKEFCMNACGVDYKSHNLQQCEHLLIHSC